MPKTPEERNLEIHERTRIRRIFSETPEVRADGFEALKLAWAYYEPAFEAGELSDMPLENCAVMAAKRCATKEFIDWLEKI
tara:strand:+ start:333 stop:575 length:243 start_codon:yes stop_codon:yes gene_type:complete